MNPLYAKIDPKLELTQCLAPKLNLPQEILGSTFESAIRISEDVLHVAIPPVSKYRVWEKISPPKLKILNEKVCCEFYNKILRPMPDRAVSEMLDEFQRTGNIRKSSYTECFRFSCGQNEQPIRVAVLEAVNNMLEDLIPEIVEAIAQEGIILQKRDANERPIGP